MTVSTFVSYPREEKAWVDDLVRRLRQARVDVFHDTDLEPGRPFSDELRREITEREFFLVVVTPELLTSDWMLREIKLADEHQRAIIPILVRRTDKFDPRYPGALTTRQEVDATNGVDPLPKLAGVFLGSKVVVNVQPPEEAQARADAAIRKAEIAARRGWQAFAVAAVGVTLAFFALLEMLGGEAKPHTGEGPSVAAVVDELKSQPRFLEDVRGPQGPTGRAGEDGPTADAVAGSLLRNERFLSLVRTSLNPPELVVDEKSRIPLVLIPGGTFSMGAPDTEEGSSSDERPRHRVTVASFYIAETEVTNGQYARFLVATGYAPPEGWDPTLPDPDVPVVVSWTDAQAFCEWAEPLRLPSEAEWEYVCRAGTQTPWSTGDELTMTDANIDGSATTAVGSYPANPWGVYDMHGNVAEWCQDQWSPDYFVAQKAHPGAYEPSSAGSTIRVFRGGAFDYEARGARSASRLQLEPSYRGERVGFRPARFITE